MLWLTLICFVFSESVVQDDMNNYISQYYSEPSSGKFLFLLIYLFRLIYAYNIGIFIAKCLL